MSKENKDNQIYRDAFSQIEKEESDRKQEEERIRQENEIAKIKNIIKAYLQKKDFIREQIKKLQEDEKIIDKDLEDLKCGRLDKIEERQTIDENARKKSIIIIERIREKYIPTYPWRSPYKITWNINSGSDYYTTMGNTSQLNNTVNCMMSNMLKDFGNLDSQFCGTSFQNFSSGTYKLNNYPLS